MNLTNSNIQEILRLHSQWLNGEKEGKRADLRGADLRRCDLQGANLQGAELGFNANFASSKGQPIYQASCGFGSRNATLTLFAKGEPHEWLFFTGCFTGTEQELVSAIKRKHEDAEAEKYLLAVQYLLNIAKLNAK